MRKKDSYESSADELDVNKLFNILWCTFLISRSARAEQH